MWTPADKARVTRELEERMERQEGGMSRFGALSKVLFEMSASYQEFTPPYVLLLIRTFLTLEGVVAHVDPTFNIYEAALPWAVQRALAPSTPRGAQVSIPIPLSRSADDLFQPTKDDLFQDLVPCVAAYSGPDL